MKDQHNNCTLLSFTSHTCTSHRKCCYNICSGLNESDLRVSYIKILVSLLAPICIRFLYQLLGLIIQHHKSIDIKFSYSFENVFQRSGQHTAWNGPCSCHSNTWEFLWLILKSRQHSKFTATVKTQMCRMSYNRAPSPNIWTWTHCPGFHFLYLH